MIPHDNIVFAPDFMLDLKICDHEEEQYESKLGISFRQLNGFCNSGKDIIFFLWIGFSRST